MARLAVTFVADFCAVHVVEERERVRWVTAAHLDPARRLALFERLAATGSQIWMTGTEAALFDGIDDATRLLVAEGRVSLL